MARTRKPGATKRTKSGQRPATRAAEARTPRPRPAPDDSLLQQLQAGLRAAQDRAAPSRREEGFRLWADGAGVQVDYRSGHLGCVRDGGRTFTSEWYLRWDRVRGDAESKADLTDARHQVARAMLEPYRARGYECSWGMSIDGTNVDWLSAVKKVKELAALVGELQWAAAQQQAAQDGPSRGPGGRPRRPTR